MERKKIVVAAGLYPPDIGGPATYARMIEGGLPDRGIDIEVLPFGTVRHLPPIIRHITYAHKLYVASRETDAVYALDSISVGLPARIVAMIRRMPLVVRLGGDYAWEQGRQRFGVTDTLDQYSANRGRQDFRTRLLAWLQDWVVRYATTVIVPSEYLAGIVRSWPKVESDRVHVVYSALFPLQVEGAKETLRAQLLYTKPTIVSAGRLVPWKGFSVLLDSFATLPDDYSLVIAGDGPERKKLEVQATKLEVIDRVRFTGSLSKEALGAAIKAADVFVLNTGYEGLSHQLLEVMDLGVPVVTTKVGGNPELLEDGVQGLLVTYNDKEALAKAVQHVLEDHNLATRYIQNARVRTKDFDRNVVLDALSVKLEECVWKKS